MSALVDYMSRHLLMKPTKDQISNAELLQFLTYDERQEVANYCGFPIRYPNWKWDDVGYEDADLSSQFPILISSKEI